MKKTFRSDAPHITDRNFWEFNTPELEPWLLAIEDVDKIKRDKTSKKDKTTKLAALAALRELMLSDVQPPKKAREYLMDLIERLAAGQRTPAYEMTRADIVRGNAIELYDYYLKQGEPPEEAEKLVKKKYKFHFDLPERHKHWDRQPYDLPVELRRTRRKP
jgi:hypothetical protein